MKVLLDWDGTIYDFCKEYFDVLNNKFNLDLNTEYIIDYDFVTYFKKLGFDSSQISKFMKVLEDYEGFYKNMKYLRKDSVLKILSYLRSIRNREIIVYTKVFKNNIATSNKIKLIEQFLMAFAELEDSEIRIESSENLKNYKEFKLIIDDNPEFISEVLDKSKIKILLPIHRYNEYLLNHRNSYRIQGV